VAYTEPIEIPPSPGGSGTRKAKAPQAASGYARAFNQLCHLIPLSKSGKWRAVIDDLIITAFVIDETVTMWTPSEVAEALSVWFEVSLSESQIKNSLERHLRAHRLAYTAGSKSLVITAEARAEVQERVDCSRKLEEDVREEWTTSLSAAGISDDVAKLLWKCLRHYMAKAFMHHGALAVQLLDPTSPTAPADAVNLRGYLDEAIEECLADSDHARVRILISSFFADATVIRARYIAHLLDATFTFFALTIHESTPYLRDSLAPLKLFLDTNFIFGLFDMHDNPMSGVSKELIEVISKGGFPFTLYFHERTLKEIQGTVAGAASRLSSRQWSSSLSRAAVQSGYFTGIELAYHKLNAESPLDAKAFISKWEHIDELLAAMGVKIYRSPSDDGSNNERKWKLIEEYRHYVSVHRPQREQSYEAADHDITVWLTVQNLRKRGRSALDVGAMFLSNDVLFSRFDWAKLREANEIGTVILPGQLLPVLRPFIPTNEDFDRRFTEAFAIPELRSAHSDYKATRFEALSFLASYKDVPQETAVSILSNDLLMHQLRGAEEGSEEFSELIESAILTTNQVLIEEKEAFREQAEAQSQAAVAEVAAYREKLASAETSAQEAVEQARREEREQAEQRILTVEAEAAADHSNLEAHLTEVRGQVAELRQQQKDAQTRRDRRRTLANYATFALVFVAGVVAMFALPHVFAWQWLLHHDHPAGLYLSGTLLWGVLCWTGARPKDAKVSLLIVGLAAVCALSTLL
jgi:chemotaxis protein histidine kinase CheA